MDKYEGFVEKVIEHTLSNTSPEFEETKQKRYLSALNYEPVDHLPVIYSYPVSDDYMWRQFPNHLIYQNPRVMFYNELVSAWGQHITDNHLLQDDLPITVRPNWGTVTVASLLGFVPEQRDDQTPWVKRGDNVCRLEDVIDLDIDISTFPWISKIIETYEYYHYLLNEYPELRKILIITLPDLQGPFDTLEQGMGEQLFIDIADKPELTRRALLRIAELQVDCMDLFLPYCTEPVPGYSYQHGSMLKGNILIRNDSVVMISQRMYSEIVAPADEYVFTKAKGGGIHSCGRIEHAIEAVFSLPGIQSFDFGQSYMNDISSIYSRAVQKKIPLLRIRPDKNELMTGAVLDKYPTGITLVCDVDSLDEAKQIHQAYLSEAGKRI